MPDRTLHTLATLLPRLVRGGRLHRAGLAAMARHDHSEALRWFERAAARYRCELQVEPLARLRVHELIARIRAGGPPETQDELCLEVERRLARLDWIESLDPPFDPVPARTLLATWFAKAKRGAPDPGVIHAA